MKFLHVTDPHVIAGGTLYHLDPTERFTACVEDMMRKHPDAEFVAITGDLTHDGSDASYLQLKRLLAHLALPTHLMIGNHDNRANFKRVFDTADVDPRGFVQHSRLTPAGRCVFLDTNADGKPHGVLDEARLEWLSTELRASANEPVFLFMHHPPFPVMVPSMDAIALRDVARFADIVTRSGNVRHIFFGHVHRAISGTWRGIPFTNLPGLNHQVALDFKTRHAVPGSHEPPAYAVIFVEADSTIIHLHQFLDRTATFNL
jgi:3',5'-cyclic AMP phosphodiesterase CpdA